MIRVSMKFEVGIVGLMQSPLNGSDPIHVSGRIKEERGN